MRSMKLEITESVVETDPRVGGQWPVTYRRTVDVALKDYGYKTGPMWEQTEKWFINGQLVNLAAYPADNDYAAARRARMTEVK